MANIFAPTLDVVMTRMLPIAPMSMQQKMWMLRSFECDEWYETQTTARKVAAHTGTVRNRVVVLLYPRDCTIVGKK